MLRLGRRLWRYLTMTDRALAQIDLEARDERGEPVMAVRTPNGLHLYELKDFRPSDGRQLRAYLAGRFDVDDDPEPTFNWENQDGAARQAHADAHRRWDRRQKRQDPPPYFLYSEDDHAVWRAMPLEARQTWYDYGLERADAFDDANSYDKQVYLMHRWAPERSLAEVMAIHYGSGAYGRLLAQGRLLDNRDARRMT